MKIISTVSDLSLFLNANSKSRNLGFVPTMGALHLGHLSLIQKALEQNDLVLCSIFVNPTQFNNSEDLEQYPDRIQEDLKALEEAGCHAVFTPIESEIYPKDYVSKQYDFGLLDKVMEGENRPGHFEGVAAVVSRLFELVKPQKAYFGEKDFQQLTIIKSLVQQERLNLEIVACPILRESDGLAMSSRNLLLQPKAREAAARIYKRLLRVKRLASNQPIPEVKKWITQAFDEDPDLTLEYFEIVNTADLQRSASWSDHKDHIACIACYADAIRLIDNLFIEIN
ncbi:MAG: pantoate--beta-alanine ligase [Flavobacteriales bacterium]|nr:pantoate--beta-alanine ligase [Flavobacteriales bacterium]